MLAYKKTVYTKEFSQVLSTADVSIIKKKI